MAPVLIAKYMLRRICVTIVFSAWNITWMMASLCNSCPILPFRLVFFNFICCLYPYISFVKID